MIVWNIGGAVHKNIDNALVQGLQGEHQAVASLRRS